MAVKFDFKRILVNHSEKLVGGLVVLLACWGFASASWQQADAVPGELIQQAKEVQQAIEGKTTWPENELEEFTTIENVKELASELGRADKLDHQRFSTRTVWRAPLNPLREKNSSVTVLAPIDPEVSGVSVAIAFPPDEDEEDENSTNEPQIAAVETDEGRSRTSDEYGGNAVAGSTGANTIGQSGQVARALGLGRSFGRGNGMGFGRRDEDEDEYDDRSGRSGLGGPASSILATADKKVEWRAGISVRMIVSLRNQRQEIAKALHINGIQNTGSYVDYQQMHIERQERRHGEWTEWERLRLDDVGEILTQSLGQDIDIVSPAVTRDGITMPLPRRAAGRWQEHQASHEKLVNFKLDEEEQEILNQIYAIMASDAEEARKNLPPPRKARKGFSQYIQSAMDLRQQLRNTYGNREDYRTNVAERVKNSLVGKDGKASDRQKRIFTRQFDQISGMDEQQATADERLLLVRFFDFNADRGVTYRYRVRLEMYNPNFQVPVDELEAPELAANETIFSEWSEATDAATVPMRYRNHVKKVKRRGTQRRVDVGIYYESDGILPVMKTVSVDVGMPIGGQGRTDRVDLEKQILEGGEVDFATSELLGGVALSVGLNTKDHKDLKDVLMRFGRGNQPVDDLVSVVDRSGSIVLKYASESSSELRDDEETVQNILSNYEGWREGSTDRQSLFSDEDDDDRKGGRGRRGMSGRGMQTGSALGRLNGDRGGRGRKGGGGRSRGKKDR